MPKDLPLVTPMRLGRIKEPFDGPEWLFELKVDGFRALAYIQAGRYKFISRNGHQFRGFQDLGASVAATLKARTAILDGELCCLGEDGRSLFNHLMFRRTPAYFYAFDLLWLNGRDWRRLPLMNRKEKLREIIPEPGSRLLYLPHLEATGIQLFHAVCDMDLEGIVAKRTDAPYYSGEKETTWVKIKNLNYSQMRERPEFFARRQLK